MANCNHGPLHAPIMGNTPVGICTKQQVEVAVIHSYHPILHAFSTLLPSCYHIPFCPSVVALVLSSIICPIMSTAAGGSWRLEGKESNSSALEFFFGVVLPLSCCPQWCGGCLTSLALHDSYYYCRPMGGHQPLLEEAGGWRVVQP